MNSLLNQNQNPNPQRSNPSFPEFVQIMKGRNPKQIVMNLLNSGQMSREQFNALSAPADSFRQMFR